MRVFPVAALGLGGALLGRATSCQGAGDACIVDLVEPDENLLLQPPKKLLGAMAILMIWSCIHLDSYGGLMDTYFRAETSDLLSRS